MTDLTRRRLLQATALLPLAAACGVRAWGADAPAARASFALDMSRPGRRVDTSLASLSYETLELSDPTFFAADNHGLVRLFREMNPHGVLRIGGNTSDDTVWGGYKGTMPAYVPRRHGKRLQPHVLQPEGLQALAGFVRATGWKLVFGVNLRIGSPEMAVDLAQAVQRLVGDRLLAIQIGNEANNYFHDYATFDAAWTPYAKALRAAGLPLAGPDTGANTDWVIEYAKRHARENVFLSRHYYREAAENGSIPDMLAGDPGFFGEVEQIMQVADQHGLPFRVSEGNSYYNGGRDGTSNVFASALWGADFMLTLAQRGVAGMHFHGGTLHSVESSLGRVAKVATGGDIVAQRAALASRYAAIAGSRALGFQPQPLFHGIALAQRFAGARMLPGRLDATGVNLTAYAAKQGDEVLVALVNKDARRDAAVALSGLPHGTKGELMRLRAPALDSRRDISFATDGYVPADEAGACRIAVPRGSAVLASWKEGAKAHG
ncbi:glycosyl hydrolase family 79 C-terminal domain-containing protein [Fulvimonas sp. R45]|uniref:glycosyl hydrolase family 79 C-terminal domain-containing protein n=1 Tax=Fulvimonas sp. R45 TaxID=3045937 RepID=UPI00265EE58C|nr:glycosyl hydrolase family 79 C-terminal domain-containing protein [Fulvimonas sp. R45]MDO1530080.1 glycosyl hydrolase family 79 C-terminal domain-containing protein [Fulvimonas sp. R45]